MGFKLKNNTVFLHVPKTGGSFIQQALRDQKLITSYLGSLHHDADRALYQEKFGSGRDFIKHLVKIRLGLGLGPVGLQDQFRFCFVRHPVSWLESFWRWQHDHKSFFEELESFHSDIRYWHPAIALRGIDVSSFESFVRGVLMTRPGFVTELYSYYTKYGVSFIGRQENLLDDLVYILKYTGLSFDEDRLRSYQKINPSKVPKSECHLPCELRDEILATERAGLILYGYESSEISGPSPYLTKLSIL